MEPGYGIDWDQILQLVTHVLRKSKRKRRSQVERKRKQKEIRTHISVSQDGDNPVPRVRVTLDQQRETRLNRRGMERVFFILLILVPRASCPS